MDRKCHTQRNIRLTQFDTALWQEKVEASHDHGQKYMLRDSFAWKEVLSQVISNSGLLSRQTTLKKIDVIP